MDILSCGFMVVLVFISGAASIITTQFHAQDGLGGYSYGYSGGSSSKTEYRAANGAVSGTYSYIDANGIVQTATYIADPVNGFRVQASNLPVASNPPEVLAALQAPVTDMPEVAAAKAAHLAAVERQKQILASYPFRQRRSVQFFTY